MYTHVSCEDTVYEEITSISNTVYTKRKKQAARSFHHTSETRHRCGRQRSSSHHCPNISRWPKLLNRSMLVAHRSDIVHDFHLHHQHLVVTLVARWHVLEGRPTLPGALSLPGAASATSSRATASAPFRCQRSRRWDPCLRCWSPTASNAHAIDAACNDPMPSLTSHSYCRSP